MFGIITVKGKNPTRWLVCEAVNTQHAWNAIGFASSTGSIGSSEMLRQEDGEDIVLAKVHRLCDVCDKPAGVYGAGHEACFYIREQRRTGNGGW